jgi:hypothetical protein
MGIAERMPGGVRATYRRLGRARWPTKVQNLRRYGSGSTTRLDRFVYVLADPEVDNFTYPIANRSELGNWLASELGASPELVGGYIAELDDWPEFDRWTTVSARRRLSAKRQVLVGRRAGWYAAVRLLKPQVVVETGMHDGVGSLTFLAALSRNASEGRPGTLLSFDPLPGTGWMVPDELKQWWEYYHEPSDRMTERLDGRRVDLFLHDSLHTYEVERAELETAAGHGCRVLLSDNAHVTSALRDTAEGRGFEFSYWQERPAGHFYPGGGIGLARASAR